VPFGPVKQITAGVLDVGYPDVGAADGPAVVLLHGWPYDIHTFAEVSPLLAAAGYRVIVPYLRGYGTTRLLSDETFRNGRYQYYFATERGRAGYERYRRAFARLIWQTASPQWDFDDATFERSAAALDNPDHVAIVIHNYRWRIGLGDGEPQYDTLERRLAEAPVIDVPTITLEGDANGAPHPEPSSYAGKFSGPHAHRTITGGIGHNLPQEAPEAFAQAVVDVNTQ
jgi:pimeloyl-ACP methyl ester carboxylesterase